MAAVGPTREQFCAAAWPRLVSAMSHYCGDRYVAEEIVQEALVRACQRWEHVAGLSSPEGWTYRVAVNLANSVWRRRRAAQRAYRRHGPDRQSSQPVAVEEQLAVREALAGLTSQQRQAVLLRHSLDLSVEEAAQVMGTSTGAIRALTHRAVVRLREVLEHSSETEQVGEEAVTDVP